MYIRAIELREKYKQQLNEMSDATESQRAERRNLLGRIDTIDIILGE